MEKSPFHSSGGQSAPAPEPASEPEPKRAPRSQARPAPTTTAPSGKGLKLGIRKNLAKKHLGAIMIAVLVLAVLVLAVSWLLTSRGESLAIDGSKYQVIWLADGNVYFGKLSVVNSEFFKASDVYYLQPQESTNSGGETQSSAGAPIFKLVKITDLPSNPEDEMIIPTAQIRHFENVKKDSQIAKRIEQDKNKN